MIKDKGYKICTKCKKKKTLNEFYHNKNSKDKLEYRCKQCKKDYEQQNKEKIYLQRKKHRQVRQDWKSNSTKQYMHNYYLNNDINKFKKHLRRNIRDSFNNQRYRKAYKYGYDLEQVVGCDIETFIKHLEQTFINKYGRQRLNNDDIEIDHIIPLSKAKNKDEVIRLSHYTNLQLLTKLDNGRKGKGE